MQNQKRIVDASRGWSNPNATRVQPKPPVDNRPRQQPVYVPKQVVRQQPVPQYTVGINPHANLVYKNPQVQQPIPVSTPIHKAQPVVQQPQLEDEKKYDLNELRAFDLTGCKSIDEVYTKNAKIIKIIPE